MSEVASRGGSETVTAARGPGEEGCVCVVNTSQHGEEWIANYMLAVCTEQPSLFHETEKRRGGSRIGVVNEVEVDMTAGWVLRAMSLLKCSVFQDNTDRGLLTQTAKPQLFRTLSRMLNSLLVCSDRHQALSLGVAWTIRQVTDDGSDSSRSGRTSTMSMGNSE